MNGPPRLILTLAERSPSLTNAPIKRGSPHDLLKYAKPDPDLFLAADERLGAPIETAVVVGDSIWNVLAAARRRILGIGVFCGGYVAEELQKATSFRGCEDLADLLAHFDEAARIRRAGLSRLVRHLDRLAEMRGRLLRSIGAAQYSRSCSLR